MSEYKPIRRKGAQSTKFEPGGLRRHRHEHWHIDNQIYFITARCRDRRPAFATEECKQIFWRQYRLKMNAFGMTPIITSLLDNRYHFLAHLRKGDNLTPLMRGLHGSVARYINEVTPEEQQVKPLFREKTGKQYFDGAIRTPRQFRRCFRYIERQCIRHGVAADPDAHPHTIIDVPMDRALKRALQINAFLPGVPDPRRGV